MPKKTKREKRLADMRRTSAPTLSMRQHEIDILPVQTPQTVSFRFESSYGTSAPALSAVSFETIRKDIVKTVVLSSLAITLEVFLAYTWK